MTESFFTVFFQMLALLLLIGTGFFATKRGLYDSHTNAKMSNLIVKIFNPLLIISSAENAVGRIPKQTLALVLLIACGAFAIFILLGIIFSPIFERSKEKRPVFQMMFVFSNLGFIGIPVVQTILGEEFVVYVTEFILIYTIIFYSYGVALVNGSFSVKALKALFNPGMIAAILALFIVIFDIKFANFLKTAISYLAGVTSPMALFVVGFSLANSDLKKVFGDVRIYLFAILKLLVIPLLLLPLLRLVTADKNLIALCMVMFGMPVGNLPLILLEQKGIDSSACSSSIILTTLFCVFTIPILLLFA